MSDNSQPPLSPTILLFARGVVAILDLWPALTIAVNEQWGGHESHAKRIWMASSLVDEFESRAVYLPQPPSSATATTSTPAAPTVDPSTANDPPLDFDDLSDFINEMMSDEFEANIEDGSLDAVTNDIIRLWRDLLAPPTGTTADSVVEALERSASNARKSGVQATAGAGPDLPGLYPDPGSDDDDDDDHVGPANGERMVVDGEEAPQLVSREREKVEPVVDEDGFTLVQGKSKGRR